MSTFAILARPKSLPWLLLHAVFCAAPLAAQYPLAPSPVLNLRTMPREAKLSGYASVRTTLRDDTATTTVNRARVTVQALPVPFAALRIQGDFSAAGRTSGDTVPAFSLTDAYVQIAPPDSGRMTKLLRPALVVGQFRTPFSIEYLTSFAQVITANRSQAVDRLSTRRDIGALAELWIDHYAKLAGAVVGGEGPNRTTSDGRQMLVGRITLFPHSSLGVSAKLLGQGEDHRWGYDARWIAPGIGVILEGDLIRRTGPVGATTTDASAGYLLAAYKVLPWLQPVVKWERLHETLTTTSTVKELRLTWVTYGINLLAPQERVRLQLNWIARSERPVKRSDEFVAQLQANF
ncbi:MAG: hypothetical protein ACR2G6_00510 [Gemmatimonadaceae bacterium]